MAKRDKRYVVRRDFEAMRRLDRRPKRKDGEEGGEAVPADPGPRPLPLEGGAEAPLE